MVVFDCYQQQPYTKKEDIINLRKEKEMFNFFKNLKTNFILIVNLLLTATTLLYMTSIFGFTHINKELISNTFIALIFAALIITILIGIISFILYMSFKTTYKKFNDMLQSFTDEIENNISKKH